MLTKQDVVLLFINLAIFCAFMILAGVIFAHKIGLIHSFT